MEFEHAPIFNRSLINQALDDYSLENIPGIQEKIDIIKKWQYTFQNTASRKTKEISTQGDFLNDFFTKILGYQRKYGTDEWNINQEQSMLKSGKSADGALGVFTIEENKVVAVIELKDANTILDKKQSGRYQTPIDQAFEYARKSGGNCRWIIVSNFVEIRLYHYYDETKYESFELNKLNDLDYFKKFYFLLNKDHLIPYEDTSFIEDLHKSCTSVQKEFSERFYLDYKATRLNLFASLKHYNNHTDELILLEKTQKILDRLLFVFFCQSRYLLDRNTFSKIIKAVEESHFQSDQTIWIFLKSLFESIDKGNTKKRINKFNGGLFKEDSVLDNLIVKDKVFEDFKKLAAYDFATQLDINILGHIFEQSISDIEELKLELQGFTFNTKKSKRKKDGIYYTPDFITKYMVQEVIGNYLTKKRAEMGEKDLSTIPEEKSHMLPSDRSARTQIINSHILFYEKYRLHLTTIKILDPACGSGAFLSQAFDYLRDEFIRVSNIISGERSGQISDLDMNRSILNNNLYGVDKNNESVEITKLSLWLKTANKQDELTSLDHNIIASDSVIGMDWKATFPEVFENGGFDIILGNPPYVRQELIKPYKEYLEQNYKVYTGRSDLYVYFFEISLNLLKQGGQMGFIVSSKYTKANYGRPLRKFILENSLIKGFVDFGDIEIFKGITAYPSIIFLERSNSEYHQKRNSMPFSLIEDAHFTNINNAITEVKKDIKQSLLGEQEWIFKSSNYLKVLSKLGKKFPSLSEVLGGPLSGIKTGYNRAYLYFASEK